MKSLSFILSLLILCFSIPSSFANSKHIHDNSSKSDKSILCTIFKVRNNHYICKFGAQVNNIDDIKQCIQISKDAYNLMNSSTRLKEYRNATGSSGPPTPGE